MKLRSTRSPSPRATLAEAVLEGLAPDGGLYLLPSLPSFDPPTLEDLRGRSFPQISQRVLSRLFAGLLPESEIRRLVEDALSFPAPVRELEPGLSVLELFHGPTGSFKDTGARFLSRLLPLLNPHPDRPVVVVVATSGDTGGAVAHAFRGVPGARAVVLFPDGRISPVQRRQIESGGKGDEGVQAVAVDGSFDDCQRLVKEVLADDSLRERAVLTSANSINIGRLLPQVCHFFHGWAQLDPAPEELVVSVPTGNVGHLVSGVMARRMGAPITRLVAATNSNDGLVRYLQHGEEPQGPSRPTLSSAMDVAIPSNLERFIALASENGGGQASYVEASSHSDEETLEAMAAVERRWGYLMDPHTAVGWLALQRALSHRPLGKGGTGLLLSTADPAKFPETVENATGRTPSPPPHWRTSAGESDPKPPSRPMKPEMAELRPLLERLVTG